MIYKKLLLVLLVIGINIFSCQNEAPENNDDHSLLGPVNDNKGIIVKLPPWSDSTDNLSRVKSRNIWNVLVNNQGEVILRNKKVDLSELAALTREFIINPNQDDSLAQAPNMAIVSLKNEKNTPYKVYLDTYNELKRAYMRLWNEEAQTQFGLRYDSLSYSQKKEVRNTIPMVISEAEPDAFGEQD